MQKTTFESYLQDWFMKDYNGDKDHFEGEYDKWLSELDTQEVMEYAEIYGKKMYVEGMDRVLEVMRPSVEALKATIK